MNTSVFSNQWYRVAGLHPRLRSQVRVTRQIYRNEVWYVLADPVSGRFHRMNAAAYAFVGRCDGRHTVDAVSEALHAHDPDCALTQDEIVRLLVHLNQRGLVQCEITPDMEAIFHREQQEQRQARRLAVNPLAFRVRLGDPSVLLDRFEPWLRLLFSWPLLLAWLALVTAGLAIAAMNFSELASHARTWMGTPRFLLIAWLLYPGIKAIHELSHALAVRRFGGEVHQVGISLMLLTPAPFVDASAASAFRYSAQRLIVSAAGIITELVVAAIALIVWLLVEPGLVRDAALVVAVIGGVSTVLFNGNPLLRFDGYYVLCDALDLPNLATRSKAWWRYVLLNRLAGIPNVPSPEPGRSEKPWLYLYAPASGVYRVGISLAIIGWIGSWSMVLGVLAGAGVAFAVVFKPVFLVWRNLLLMPLPEVMRRRVLRIGVAASVILLILVAGVPLPFATVAQGVVWIPEQAQLRVGAEGFIAALEARHGDRVEAGQELVRLEDSQLAADAVRLTSQLDALDADLYQGMVRDPVKAANVEEEIGRVKAHLARVQELQGLLVLRAGASGTLVMPRQSDTEGAFVPRGALLGHILTGEAAIVRVVVEQDVAALVRDDTHSVVVQMAELPGESIPARLLRTIPAATERLPSAALGEHAGGSFAVDPADKDHLQTPTPVFVFDVILDGHVHERAGGRAWVRFDHGWTPLVVQWGRRLKQLFLRNFDPSA
jgi:putative peptide zinc metalloprotease protein